MDSTKVMRLGLLGLVVCILGLYGQFLHNPIVFDDIYFFLLGRDGHVAVEAMASPSLIDLRALPYASLAWSAEIFGLGLPPFRVENLVLHAVLAVSLVLFVMRLYRQVFPESQQVVGENTRLSIAILIVVSWFALHPVAVYAVGYLVQRTMLMATLFSVLCIWAYLHGYTKQRSSWLWVSVALYFLATHSKEHVIMLPAVIVAMLVLLDADWRVTLRKQRWVFAGFLAVAVLTAFEIRGVLGHAYEINADEMYIDGLPDHVLFYSVLTQCALYFKYGILWLLPNPNWMSVDMREPLAHSLFSIYGVALVAYVIYGFFALRLLFKRGKLGMIGFALLLPWLMFLTEFTTVRVQEIFVLYRSYIWAMGGVILLPLLLMRFNERLTILLGVLVAACLFMVAMERLSTFSHPILLWDDAEKLVKTHPELPGVGRIYYNRGTAWLNEDRVDQALPDIEKATQLNPRASSGFYNLGLAYAKANQHALAISQFTHALSLDQKKDKPVNYRYYLARAISEEALGQWVDAKQDYQKSCELSGHGCDKAEAAIPK